MLIFLVRLFQTIQAAILTRTATPVVQVSRTAQAAVAQVQVTDQAVQLADRVQVVVQEEDQQ